MPSFPVPTIDPANEATTEAAGDQGDDASAISISDAAGDFDATDVEGALAELQTFDETLSVTYAAKVTVLEGTSLFGFGSSYPLGSVNGHTLESRYLSRLLGRYRFGSLTNRGVSGALMEASAGVITGNSANRWVAGTFGAVVLDAIINNVRNGSGSASRVASLRQAARAALACLSASARTEHTTFTLTGTWATQTDSKYSGGTATQTTVANDYAEFTFTGASTYLLLWCESLSASPCSSIELSEGGVVFATITQTNQAVFTGGIPFVIAVNPASGSGAHTIRVTHKGAGGEKLTLDALLPPSTTPPEILTIKGVTVSGTGWGGQSQTDLDLYNAALVTATAEFSNAHVIDPNVGWDVPTMLGPDDLHINDAGTRHYADALSAHLDTLTTFREGLHKL